MSELKPCPFCPGGGELYTFQFPPGREVVQCQLCAAQVPIAAWNTRPADAVREAAKAAVEEWIGGDPDEFLIAMGRLRAVVEEK